MGTKKKVDKTRELLALMAEAGKNAKWRQHDLGGFEYEHGSEQATAACKKCGMSVTVTVAPRPNERAIMGEAIAVNCNG